MKLAHLITPDGTIYNGRILSGDLAPREKGSIVIRFKLEEVKPCVKR